VAAAVNTVRDRAGDVPVENNAGNGVANYDRYTSHRGADSSLLVVVVVVVVVIVVVVRCAANTRRCMTRDTIRAGCPR
jgi:t-SNARE complex subunit (syntaxin)